MMSELPAPRVTATRPDAFRPDVESDMRVMVIVKASKNSEAGKMPSEKLLGDMM